MKLFTYDDITGDGAKHQLTSLLKVGGVAVSQTNWDTKWVQLTMQTASGVSRVGDVNVSSTNGIPLNTTEQSQFVPPIAFATDKYEMTDLYVIINNGDVMSVARAV